MAPRSFATSPLGSIGPAAALATCLAMLLTWGVPASAADSGCETCHSQKKFFAQNKRLYDYYQDWLTSPHREAGISCEQCHGGNAAAVDEQKAHEGVFGISNPNSRVFHRNQPSTCGKCHARLVEHFTHSAHHKALMGEAAAPNCSTCHRAMNRKPYFFDIVDNACRACHVGTSPKNGQAVADIAHDILHRLNVSKGYLGWTTVYYETNGWPGQTKQQLTSLRERYHDILATGHSFDLQQADRASIELLAELKSIFRKAWKEKASN